jgi:cellulose synthase (UDP-forming)
MKKQTFLKILFFAFLLIYMLLVFSMSPNTVQLGFFFIVFSIGLILVIYAKTFKKESEYIKLFLLFSALLFSLRYFVWRTFYTLNFDNFFNALGSLMAYVGELYAFIVFLLGAFIALRTIERKEVDIYKIPRDKLPSVDIYIPTYNEPVEIVRTTAIAASLMDYPKDKYKVYILDDGGTAQKTYIPQKEIEEVKKEIEEIKTRLKEEKTQELENLLKEKEEKLNQLLEAKKKAIENRKRAEELKKMANEIGDNVFYLTREKNEHAKAGNINEALKKTDGDLVLILDCDHVPTQDFLKNTVGFFVKNPKLFLVQTPHKFYNPDPIEKNLRIFRQVPNESEMFYNFIQKGLDFWDASFFCGSAAILRRKYLEEVGGIAGDTITEDAETALELHAKGYESYYYPKGMVFGLQPESFSSFIVQRSRWAQGMIQIFLLKNPIFKKGLKWHQRLGYLNSNVFWFFGIARVMFLIAPLFFIFFNFQIYNATLENVIAFAFPHFLFVLLVSYYLYSKYRWPFFSEVYESIQSLFLLPAIMKVLKNPRAPTFIVTPKGEEIEKDFISPFYKPIFILFNLTLLAIIVGIYRFITEPSTRGTLIILGFWEIMNLVFLGLGLIVVHEKPEKRKAHRIPANDDAVVYVKDKVFNAKVRDISLTGIWLETMQDISPYLDEIRDSELKFLIQDARGVLFVVKGKVVNANSHNIRMTFHFENIESERKITELVYSQSSRWEYFFEEKDKDPFSSFMFLLKLTLKDFKVAYLKTLNQFIEDILSLFSIKKIKGA